MRRGGRLRSVGRTSTNGRDAMKLPLSLAPSGLSRSAPSARWSAAHDRWQRSIDGPVTREAVTRSLALVPANAGDADGLVEISVMLRIGFEFESAELTGQAERDLHSVAARAQRTGVDGSPLDAGRAYRRHKSSRVQPPAVTASGGGRGGLPRRAGPDRRSPASGRLPPAFPTTGSGGWNSCERSDPRPDLNDWR